MVRSPRALALEDHTRHVAPLEEVIHVEILGFVVVDSTIEEYSVNLKQ